MIGQIVAHGRTAQDRRNLNIHLWKTAGQVPTWHVRVHRHGDDRPALPRSWRPAARWTGGALGAAAGTKRWGARARAG